MAGIVVLSQATGASIVQQEEGPAKIQSAPDFAPHPQRNVSARYSIRGIVLLLIILILQMLWLIYRTFTGWKPMIS